jgi:lipoprotein-anchoring transpeptidase ErfK/SrfK
MVPTSRFVLRGGLAAAVAVLASSLSGTIAVAQQVAVNTEDQAASEPSDEERSGEADARQIVPFHTSEAPGTIIIDTGERYLYLVQPNNLAIRYGIGVGRIGFQWSGVERVSQKQEWPDWHVPSEMVRRQPYLPRFMAAVQAIPSAREPSISGTPSSASTERTSRRRSGTPFHRDAFVSITPT